MNSRKHCDRLLEIFRGKEKKTLSHCSNVGLSSSLDLILTIGPEWPTHSLSPSNC